MDPAGSLVLPLRTLSVLNLREHWGARHRRTKRQRSAVEKLWPWSWKRRSWAWPLEVRLVRLHPPRNRIKDDDNLHASLKAVRDQVAAELGVDDGDAARVRWEVDQERGAWGVRVELREASPVCPRCGRDIRSLGARVGDLCAGCEPVPPPRGGR